MQTEAVQAFVTACDVGSLNATAEALHISQPAVSKRLANLESRLGHALFDRVGRGLVLTEAGRAYLPHARELLAVMADGTRALDSLGGTIAGPLSLALSHHVSLHRMPVVLRRFVQRYPDVSPEITFADSEAACRYVENGHCEVAVITLPTQPHAVLMEHPVWSDPLRFYTAPQHPLARLNRVSSEELAAHPAVLPPAGSTTRQIIDEVFDVRALRLEARMESHYLETLRMLADVGLGWTVLPSAMAHPDLIELSIDSVDMTRRLGAVTHPRRSLSNAAQALLGLLDEAKQNDDHPAA